MFAPAPPVPLPAVPVSLGAMKAARKRFARRSAAGLRLPLLALCILCAFLRVPAAAAQISGAISGTVTDASGQAVTDASVTARNVDTGVERSTATDARGHYEFVAIPLGAYEVSASKQGFAQAVRTGINVVVNENGNVNLVLKIGSVNQQITVTGDAPLVSVTTQDISGLVGEQQVKDLPLNGRSYDLLLTLNPGVVNFTWEKSRRYGSFQFHHRQQFRRFGQPPAAESFPAERRGVHRRGGKQHDARRRQRGTAGRRRGARIQHSARYLRRGIRQEAGRAGQHRHAVRHESVARLDLRIPAQQRPGCAQLLRCRASAPPFQRNQFGVSLGGPIQKDKTFVFAQLRGIPAEPAPDVRGVRSRRPCAARIASGWCASDLAAAEPVAHRRRLALPTSSSGADGVAQVLSSPLQTIREDFGTVRVDHVFSERDSLARDLHH